MFTIDPSQVYRSYRRGLADSRGRASLLLVLRLNQDDCRVVGEDARHRRHVADVLCVARTKSRIAFADDRAFY